MTKHDITYDHEMSLYLMVWNDYSLLGCAFWLLNWNNMVSTKGAFMDISMVLIAWFPYLVQVECSSPYLSYFLPSVGSV